MMTKPVLYAEDEETDSFFLKRAFQRVGILNPLLVVPDGQAAIDFLWGIGRKANRNEYPWPSLVLLDLNMPKKSGIEVLKWIRQEQTTCTTPVVMFTSSLQDADIRRSYIAGANAYLGKPSHPDELIVSVKTNKEFWLGQNRTCE